MNGIISKKTSLAAAVMTATLGLAATTAQADSLLAPLIMNTTTGAIPSAGVGTYSTYLNLKVKGAGNFNEGASRLHYVWIKKGERAQDLANLLAPCDMINNNGKMTKWDMMFQDTGHPKAIAKRTPDGFPHHDKSTPNTYSATDFVGMLVVSDTANTDTTKVGSGAPEGDMSGFAYIVNDVNGDVQDYKLLNNHHSAEEGDFSAGFVSKHVVDLAWMGNARVDGTPYNTVAATGHSTVQTAWFAAVTGPDMAKHDSGFNSTYDATVVLSQEPRGNEDSPQVAMGGTTGVYNNDEVLTSGETPLSITCMGLFEQVNFLDAQQVIDTANGGWLRKSIIPQTTRPVIQPAMGGNFVQRFPTDKEASGAIIYRDDEINGRHTMQVETSGHLAPGANHANRPY